MRVPVDVPAGVCPVCRPRHSRYLPERFRVWSLAGGRRVQCASMSAQDCSSGTACCRPVSALELLVVQVMFGLHQPSTVFSLVLYGLNLLHVELCQVPSFFSFIARDIFLFNLVVVYKHYSYKS